MLECLNLSKWLQNPIASPSSWSWLWSGAGCGSFQPYQGKHYPNNLPIVHLFIIVHWHKVTTERRSIVVFHCSMEWETKIEEPQLKKNQSKVTYLWSCTAKQQHSVLFNRRILAIGNCTNWQDSAAHQPLLLLTSLKRCLLGDATVTGAVDEWSWQTKKNIAVVITKSQIKVESYITGNFNILLPQMVLTPTRNSK